MDYARIRKVLLKAFLGFLGLTALIAIVSVLAGEFGETQWKILATTFTVSSASICSMSCAAFIERKKHIALGLSGILLSVCAAILLIVGIWPEIDNDTYWKTTITLAVLAVGSAHAFLLVLPELAPTHKWVQPVASVCIGVLALQIIIAVWGEIDENVYYRVLTAVAIIVGLETLAVPILMKLRPTGAHRSQKLVLEQVQGSVYRDSSGRTYELHEIGPGPVAAPDGDPDDDASRR